MVSLWMILYLAASAADCALAETINFAAESERKGRKGMDRARQNTLHRWFKGFKFCLMPLLLLYYTAACLKAGENPSVLIVLALLLGCGGDVLLEMGEKWFPVGTLSFLLGHIFYVIAFLIPVKWGQIPPLIWTVLILYGVYGFLMLRSLFQTPAAYQLRHVLILYLAALISLNLSALLRVTYVNTGSFEAVLIGSVLFLISDTILAFALFQDRSRHGIMIFYTAAQFLLIRGLLMA